LGKGQCHAVREVVRKRVFGCFCAIGLGEHRVCGVFLVEALERPFCKQTILIFIFFLMNYEYFIIIIIFHFGFKGLFDVFRIV
jgi:hypothetical protein